MIHSIFAKIVTCSEKLVCTLSIHDFIMGIILFNNIITTTLYLFLALRYKNDAHLAKQLIFLAQDNDYC